MTMLPNRIRGLKGAVTIAQRMVDANKEDISRGIDYRAMLVESEKKLARLKARLERAQQGYWQ